jgi:two-component system, NtrC family, response regulator AtoC
MAKQPISILAVDDEEANLETLTRVLSLEGYFVQTAQDGLEAINVLQTLPFDMILLDIRMPRVDGLEVLKYVKDQQLDAEVIMLTGVQEVRIAVECMKLGAYYYITKPYVVGDLLALIGRALDWKRMVIHNKALKRQVAYGQSSSKMIGKSKYFVEMLDLALRAAPTDASVLIQGSSGTGKELVAEFLHGNSPRKDQPFLALNCSSIPEGLLESELFGHEKGAFTDAKSMKEGLVEMANGGTLFLDEIGDMAITVQPKLLRFLQTGEYRRVGGNKNLRSDVRVISASNKDLRQLTAAGRFREDLLYRINVVTVGLPSLRDRKDDIPLLVEHFLKGHAGKGEPKRLDARALELLMKYDWPGNIRELENVIERAAVLSQDNMICIDDLALPLAARSIAEVGAETSRGGVLVGSAMSLDEIEIAHVRGVLHSVSWNKKTAAEILGLSVKTLYSKIQAYGLTEAK